MAEKGAHQAERNGHHDDNGPTVGGKHPGQYQIDQNQAQHHALLHIHQGFSLIGRASLKGVIDAVTFRETRQGMLDQQGIETVDIGDGGVHIGHHFGRQLSLGMP